MEALTGGGLAALAGLGGGTLLGLAARLGGLCMMGAVEDAVYGGDTARLRMLAMAGASALFWTYFAVGSGAIDPYAAVYLRYGWSPAAAILGGLLFGFGMAQVGTCGFGALARAGSGDLRSLFMVMVIGMAGAATLSGPLEPIRTGLIALGTVSGDDSALAQRAGGMLGISPVFVSFAVAAVLAGLALLGGRLGERFQSLGWGALAGGTIAFGWIATSYAAATGFDIVNVQSFSFVAPLGATIKSVMAGSLGTLPDFAVASVIGVPLGAALGSALRGVFRWEACDDARELRRQIFGAVLMGVGGVLALGCSVGQGLAALSVLSASAPVVILSIFVGARIGLFLLVEGMPGRHGS